MAEFKELIPEVVQALADDSYGVYAYFNDGSVRYKNLQELISKGGVFSKIQDPVIFKDTITVMNGTVAWDVNGTWDRTAVLDIDPIEFYETAGKVPCPLTSPEQ